MTAKEDTLERVRGLLAGFDAKELESSDDWPVLETTRDDLPALLGRLKTDGAFETVTFVTAVDRYPKEPRFEVHHQLHSLAHNQRLRVKTRVSGADPKLPTCIGLWPGAAYMERECFDMFGIVFEGHDGLKRLLMPEGYGHHPLRKEFPHQGIEPDRLYREWDRARRKTWTVESETR